MFTLVCCLWDGFEREVVGFEGCFFFSVSHIRLFENSN